MLRRTALSYFCRHLVWPVTPLWAVTVATPLALARDTNLPLAHDLQSLAARQITQREPLVILVSLPRCPYCELVRRHYLLPYRAEKLADSWQLDTTDNSALVDFAGKTTTKALWTKAMRIKVTPTVLFLDGSGREIAPRLEGVAVLDFYGAYLDERLATARRKLM